MIKNISVGRSPENDIVVQDVLVSSKHLLLSRNEAGELFVEDLNSTNGTLIDAVLLRGGRQGITYNTLIKIGDTVLEWQHHFQNIQTPLPTKEAQEVQQTPILPEEPPAHVEVISPKNLYITQTDKPAQWLRWTAVGMGAFFVALLLFWYFSFVRGV